MHAESPHTFHAIQAIQVSELLAVRFAEDCFGTAPPRRLNVTQPDGPSTDGGRKARQAMVLAAADGSNALMCGFLDVAHQKAEVRSFSVISQEFSARHKRPIDISRGEYERFVREARDFLMTQGMSVHVSSIVHVPQHRPASVPPAPRPRGRDRWAFAVVGLVAGVTLGWAVFTVLGRLP